MRVNFIQMNVSGLKCDNPNCDYRDSSIKYEDYSKYVDMPCPKCGTNLLTRSCYKQTVKNVNKAKRLNNFLNLILPDSIKMKAAQAAIAYAHFDCDAEGNPTNLTSIERVKR